MLKKIIIQIFIFNFALVNNAQSGESGGMPQLNPEFWVSQIVWLVLTFGILSLPLVESTPSLLTYLLSSPI